MFDTHQGANDDVWDNVEIHQGNPTMNAFTLTKDHLIRGLKDAEDRGIEPSAYGQALLWNLLQYYKSQGRSETDIRDEIGYALDNLDDDGDFHVSRN